MRDAKCIVDKVIKEVLPEKKDLNEMNEKNQIKSGV